MQKLPIHKVLTKIHSHLSSHNKLILQASPGAGKTTIVPISLLDEPWLEDKQIIMLEPRRLATRNAARRMAQLLGEEVGQTVGYQIRSDRSVSAQTKIIVVTEGILTRMLQSDPALENIALIIFDEFHERNLHGDLALALALQSQEIFRDDLKIMVMSATLNAQALSELLDNAPLIISEGRSFPVENIYLDTKTPQPSPKQLPALISKTVQNILRTQEGSILIFLPGLKEIKNLELRLRENIQDSSIIIAPLYGDMSKEAQDKAISPLKEGNRKIVIATNIAETSLTIEGITAVIDSGLQRVSHFNSATGMNQLLTIKISQDAATQRSGRAGRLSEGKSYRLWHEHTPLTQHSTPEILTSDLVPMVLELAAWGADDINELHWLELPKISALNHARELLVNLGALEKNTITPHGRAMLKLATHPRLAHMMLKASEIGASQTAFFLAALLSEKDIFIGDARYSCDLEERLSALVERLSGAHIDKIAFTRVIKTSQEFSKKLKQERKHHLSISNILGILLGFAYPERIAKSRSSKSASYLLSGGKGALLPNGDTLLGEAYLVVANLDASRSNARIFSAATIGESDIQEYFSELITLTRLTRWNDEKERVEVRELRKLGAITLSENIVSDIHSGDIKNALLEAVRERGLESLQFSKEARSLQQRVNFLNYNKRESLHVSELIGELPDFSDAWLLENLHLWLSPHLEGIKNFKTCRKLNIYSILLGLLSYDKQQHINKLAPQKIEVPSGSKIYINYENPASPLLSVRLQELFGMLESPLLIGLHVKLSIDLLSPAHRSMQITQDLQSFWENTYHEVRKELRGKYKKHYWPENPFEAKATNKTKKNM
ncbi:MAG: ATP-dependent helicase HrpB [Campylobacterota bacterium]|nr:ATP-dependent helicase HrpB [Campylobacterota bacterium]